MEADTAVGLIMRWGLRQALAKSTEVSHKIQAMNYQSPGNMCFNILPPCQPVVHIHQLLFYTDGNILHALKVNILVMPILEHGLESALI